MDATTFNPADKHDSVTLSNGDLTATNPSGPAGYGRLVRCTIFLDNDQYYAEYVLDVLPTSKGEALVGFANGNASIYQEPGNDDDGVGFYIDPDVGTYGAIKMRSNGVNTTIWEKPDSPAIAAGDILQVAIDMDTGSIWVGHNNTWSGDPAAGTGAAKTGWDFGTDVTLAVSVTDSAQYTLNPESSAQTYSAPAGFHDKWNAQVDADITAAMGASDPTPVISKEKHVEISGDLGAHSEPWKWFSSLGVGAGEIDDNLLDFPVAVSGVIDAFRDRSPITGDVGLAETTEMYRWHGGLLVSDPQVGLGFTPSVELQYEVEAIFVGTGLGCSMEALNFSEFLRANPEASKRYICVLTGLTDNTTDFTLPISSAQGRFRSGSPSYLSVQVPTYAYIDEILARINGDIVVYCILVVAGVEQIRQEIARASLDDPRTDRGGKSQTVTLSGHSTGTFGSESVTIQNVQETGESNGKKKVVASVDIYLRPGNTAVVPGFGSFTVGLVSYSISAKGEKMEVVEA